ncbi:MAG: pirin family protein [Burkholderiaceae bacterium]|nr:pirin family protein [Burkholderiaceae bacterium]
MRSREVERVVAGQETHDGAGVRLTRVLTQDLQRRLDPFLMLDAFRSDDPEDYIGGFPEHPHRGFETVTYMLAGRMRHRDSSGNEGLLTAGGVQWMTAGRGILHSEMPEQEDGLMEGFQLWVNLPARNKMTAPDYRDIAPDAIPEFVDADGTTIRLIAGTLRAARSGGERVQGEQHGEQERVGAVVRPDTEPLFVDLHLRAGARIDLPIPVGHNAFVYVYRGEMTLGAKATPVVTHRMAVLETSPEADCVALRCAVDSRAIVVAGRPLGEPIAQYGPFVMNTRAELMQAVHDLNTGKLAPRA